MRPQSLRSRYNNSPSQCLQLAGASAVDHEAPHLHNVYVSRLGLPIKITISPKSQIE